VKVLDFVSGPILPPLPERNKREMPQKEMVGSMVIYYLANGNPGALKFCVLALDIDPSRALRGLSRMYKHGIVEDKLYMLWNDCCARDTKKTIDIMNTHSIEDIIRHINYDEGRGIPYEEDDDGN